MECKEDLEQLRMSSPLSPRNEIEISSSYFHEFVTEIDNAIPLTKKSNPPIIVCVESKGFCGSIIEFFVKIIAKIFGYRSL